MQPNDFDCKVYVVCNADANYSMQGAKVVDMIGDMDESLAMRYFKDMYANTDCVLMVADKFTDGSFDNFEKVHSFMKLH